ncbi:MAG: methyltransferase domain-containing protein [Methanobacterium sp.]|uniref:class I SAM-dependent methyltransferase n=1 Tax=Methanobacterium sp. TaxID=2164 RepID=UPI003D65F1CE|nr:methyltransferase domain-containing protein [Methanobacterium sp.]
MSDENIKFWAEMSSRYDSVIDDIFGGNIRPKILEKLNEEEDMGKLIELGCGTGYFTKTLANKSESITSTDISEEMLEIAKERLKECNEIKFHVMDFQDCKFDDGTFDTVFMGLVLLFADDPLEALKESRRILKSEGAIIIADPDISFLSFYGMLKFRFRALLKYRRVPSTGHLLNQKKIVDMLDKTGFEVVKKEIIQDESNPYSISANYIKAKISK